MKTLKLTQSTMEKRISRFLDLEPLPIQIDETIPQAGKDIVYARKLFSETSFASKGVQNVTCADDKLLICVFQ